MKEIYFFTIGILLLVAASAIGDSVSSSAASTVTLIRNDSNPNITNHANGSVTSVTYDNATRTVRKFVLKPTLTRTELKVSRSLNPDSMQTLNVRTNDGGVATILVKKRDGRNSVNQEPRQVFYDTSNQFSRGEVRKGLFGPVQVLERVEEPQQQNFQHPKAVYGDWRVLPPSPSAYRFAAHSPDDQKSISLINSFMKHVEQIEGRNKKFSVDENSNDRRPVHIPVPTMRVANDARSDFTVPEPVVISSDTVFVKNQNKKPKRGRSMIEVGADGIPLVHGVREPDDENDKRQTWRNARVINGELVPYEKGYVPPRTVEYGELVYPVRRSSPPNRAKSIGPFITSDNFSDEEESNQSIGPFSVNDMFRNTNRNVRSDSSIGPFTVADNSGGSNSKLIDYIKKINDNESRKNYFMGDLRYRDFPGQQPKIQRRMLTQPGNQEFPVSSKYLYSQEENKEMETMSGPVLQYAHPEFGVQQAKIGSTYEDTQSKSNNKNNNNNNNNQQQKPGKIEYYTKPAYDRPAGPQNHYKVDPSSLNMRETYSFPPAYSMKTPPATYPYNYGFIRRVRPERPFWMKLTDGMRNGIAQVQEFTRPVIDPIMEAGHKISANLGFVQQRPEDRVAQEKVGVVYPSVIPDATTMVLPAIGLVAGGAALGLGALGWRIFNYANIGGLLSRADQEALLDLEHKRAMDAINNVPKTTLYLVQNESPDDAKRYRRNLKYQYEDIDYKNDKYDDMIEVYEPQSSTVSTTTEAPARNNNNNFLELIAIPLSTSSQPNPISSRDISPGEAIKRSKRTRRSIGVAIDDSLGSILQDIERDIPKTGKHGFEQQIRNTDWSNTPCAKKTFCQVMIHQNQHDEILFMEKKISTLLQIMHPALRASLSHHLTEVTDAIRRYDCSQFVCYQN